MNITEYIMGNGIYDIKMKPFNCVDSLILSQLSYLKFEGLIGGPDDDSHGITLRDMYVNHDISPLFRDERYEELNRPFFDAACRSFRFGNVILNNFIDIVDEERQMQFSAMTALFEDNSCHVIFRGTDDNLIGWKEDADMSYETEIPAQREAVRYLEKIADKFSGPIYVMGHSKGGNLSVYASMMVNEKIQSRIEKIFSHDGPGFLPEVLQSGNFDVIKNKITKLVPKSSLVGMLLTTGEAYEVVESLKYGAMQHSPFNWVVEGFDFKRVPNVDKYSVLHERALKLWTDNMTTAQRKYLADEAYAILTNAGISNLNDFNDALPKKLYSIIQSAGHLDDESKKKLREIFGILKDAAMLTLLNR